MRRRELPFAASYARCWPAAWPACAGKRTGNPPEPPTLKSLAGRQIDVQADAVVGGTEEKAIAAYRKFLEVAPNAPQRSEAMRRLGDLEMDTADNKLASGEG